MSEGVVWFINSSDYFPIGSLSRTALSISAMLRVSWPGTLDVQKRQWIRVKISMDLDGVDGGIR